MKFVYENDPSVIKNVGDRAGFGCVEIVKWVYDIRKNSGDPDFNIHIMASLTIKHGKLPALKWLIQMEPNNICIARCCTIAIHYKKIEILKWIVMTGHVLDRNAYYILANYKYHYGEMLEWLRTKSCIAR